MIVPKSLILPLLSMLAVVGVRAGEAQAPRTRGVYELSFVSDQWVVKEPVERRITSRNAVTIKTKFFNFLKYTLSYDIKEERLEEYQYLNKLWTSLLSPSRALLPEAFVVDQSQLIQLCRTVYAGSLELEESIAEELSKYQKLGLTEREAQNLNRASFGADDNSIQQQHAHLKDAYARLYELIRTNDAAFQLAFGDDAAYVEIADQTFKASSDKAQVFLNLAQRTVGVEEKRLGTYDAGTRVTVTLTATDPNGVKKDFQEIQYVVHTTIPLVVHSGISFANLDDVKFEKIRRAVEFSQDDLFQLTSQSGNTTEFSLFLSWQLVGFGGSLDTGDKDYKASILLSLGTDLGDFGKRIYVGPSAMLFGRFVVTVGAALGSRSEGDQQTLEPNVFRLIKEETSTSFFFSIGVRLF